MNEDKLKKDVQDVVFDNMENMLFIKTKDESTYKQLIAEGFNIISFESGVWTFLNEQKENRKQTFDKKKVCYSNMLCI